MNFLKKAYSFVKKKIETRKFLKQSRKESIAKGLSKREIKKREKLIKKSQKQFKNKLKSLDTDYTIATGEKFGNAKTRYLTNRKTPINEGLPQSFIPKRISSTEELKELNNALEMALSRQGKQGKLDQYRKNMKTAIDKVFEEKDANFLKKKLDMITDKDLSENILLFEGLDISYYYLEDDYELNLENISNTFDVFIDE